MSDMPTFPSMTELLSADFDLLHETRRTYVEKRIVERDGVGYVLYRIPSYAKMLRFESVLRQAAEAGVGMQSMVHGRHVRHGAGHWLALGFVTGQPLGNPRPGPGVYRAFGRILARLHSQESDQASSLLRARIDNTPYERVLARPDLSGDERRWIAQSSERMYQIKRFQLTHGDLHRQNILVGPDLRVSLIDYELFAFEPAGLELAMVLLRNYCRNPRNRRLVLENYLAYCKEGVAELWQQHSPDLLFAAALRLAAQRNARRRILQRQSWLLSARELLGNTRKAESTHTLAAKRKLSDGASARMLAYDGMAMRILQMVCANPQASALELLSAAHGN